MNTLSLEEELKRTVRRLNLLLVVLAIELIPITLVAIYFLVMMLAQFSHPEKKKKMANSIGPCSAGDMPSESKLQNVIFICEADRQDEKRVSHS